MQQNNVYRELNYQSDKLFLQVEATGRSKKLLYYLPTFDEHIESKSLPFSFATDDKKKHPSHDHLCDATVCSDSTNTNTITLNCFHTFHTACLDDSSCPLCITPLMDTVQKLANSFNTNLTQAVPNATNSTEADNEDDDHEGDALQADDQRKTYYLSDEWPHSIEDTVHNIQIKSQPKFISKNSSQPVTIVVLPIYSLPHNNVKVWLFPKELSQSTILGRQSSNACTFISILNGFSVVSQTVPLLVSSTNRLQPFLTSTMVSSILKGNSEHDKATSTGGNLFSVRDACQHLKCNRAIPNCTTSQEHQYEVGAANQEHTFEQHLAKLTDREIACVIKGSMTVCFVKKDGMLFLMDSHYYTLHGAYIACSRVEHVKDLVNLFHIKSSIRITLGSITVVKF